MSEIREDIRRLELERAWSGRPQGLRVLEIGGQRGFQAKMLHDWGNRVTSVDIALPEQSPCFPVALYDGCRLPFADRSFDVVFSSNVLEHVAVKTLPALLAETARVLRPGSTAIHILPSPTWRIATIFAHYPWGLLYLLGMRSLEPSRSARRTRHELLRLAYRAFIPPAHGVYPSAVSELYFYSIRRWCRVFRSAGWDVEDVQPAGVFYSGYKVTGRSLAVRQRLARVFGSSCNIFTMRVGGGAR